MVQVDEATRKSRPFSEAVRTRLEQLTGPAGS